MPNFINEVVLQGTVVGKIANEKRKFCILTLATTKYQKKDKESGQNYPRVAFFGDESIEAMKYNKHDHVYITGKLLPYNYKRKDNPERLQKRQRIVGFTIKKSNLEGERKHFSIIKDRMYEPLRNEVTLSGIITDISVVKPTVVVLTIAQGTRKSSPTLKVTYYTNAEVFNSLYKKEDSIFTVGTISTVKPDNENIDKNLESYVAKEVLKMNL